jgi:hypothetical protein
MQLLLSLDYFGNTFFNRLETSLKQRVVLHLFPLPGLLPFANLPSNSRLFSRHVRATSGRVAGQMHE